MIRKLTIDQLLPGMYVVDLHKSWLDHSLWIKRFAVRDEAHIWKLKEEGITEVSIDTARGIDLPPSPIARINEVERRIKSLAEIKADARLKDIELVRLSRLSVAEITPAEWALVSELGAG